MFKTSKPAAKFTPEQIAERRARHERELKRKIAAAKPQTGRAVFTIAGASE